MSFVIEFIDFCQPCLRAEALDLSRRITSIVSYVAIGYPFVANVRDCIFMCISTLDLDLRP